MVKVFILRAEDPEFESPLQRDFFWSSHISDFIIGTPVTTLQGAWQYRVSAGTGRPVPVYCDLVNLICNFCLSVAALKLSEQIRPWDTLARCWDDKQPTNKQSSVFILYLSDGRCVKDKPIPSHSLGKNMCIFESVLILKFPNKGCVLHSGAPCSHKMALVYSLSVDVLHKWDMCTELFSCFDFLKQTLSPDITIARRENISMCSYATFMLGKTIEAEYKAFVSDSVVHLVLLLYVSNSCTITVVVHLNKLSFQWGS